MNRNRVQCHKCLDVIESKHVHDFVYCRCKNIAVDGGQDYFKRSFAEDDTWTELPDDDSYIIAKEYGSE